MDVSNILRTINWKTTGCALAYLICNVVGALYPPAGEVCSVLDKIFVALGIMSAADAQRVQNVVQAVDHIFDQVKVDPATIAPPNMKAAVASVPAPVVS